MNHRRIFYLFLALLVGPGWTSGSFNLSHASAPIHAIADSVDAGSDPDREYHEFVEDWHRNRIERLNDEHGWLRLAGLYWLSEGQQSFGSGSHARVHFPEGSIPEMAGIFEVREDTVFMRVVGNVDIRDERGRRIRDDVISTPEMTRELTYRSLTWFVVRREEKIGIRLFDDNSPHLQHFDGIDRYEVDRDWRIEARFEPKEEGTTMLIENVLGQMVEWDVAGSLTFSREGREVTILALGTGDRLFIPFADATSGSETYPGGRFVYIDRPEPGEPAIVDFNVSYNPPCAINPHTTCPLPPPQNRMPFPIRAGEKHYEMYDDEES
ncbi:MAG: DUF1684 domain-containing protein [Cyclonatronaceae bacterium]